MKELSPDDATRVVRTLLTSGQQQQDLLELLRVMRRMKFEASAKDMRFLLTVIEAPEPTIATLAEIMETLDAAEKHCMTLIEHAVEEAKAKNSERKV